MRNPAIVGLVLVTGFASLCGCASPKPNMGSGHQGSSVASSAPETRKVQVTGREFINAGDSYSKVKQALVNELLMDAVRQGVGIEIRKRTSSSMTLADNRLSEEFKELNIEKARGYISEYAIAQEKVVEEGGRSLLIVVIDAEVRVPKNRIMREVVAIGDITWPAQNNAVLKQAGDLVATAYFDNPRFDLIKGDPEKEYHDWVMTGKLVGTSSRNTTSRGRAIGNSFMQGLLVNGRPVAKVDERVVRVSATVYMQAENAMDKTVLSDTTTEERDFPVTAVDNGLDQMVNKMIDDLFVKSTRNVFNKLLKRSAD